MTLTANSAPKVSIYRQRCLLRKAGIQWLRAEQYACSCRVQASVLCQTFHFYFRFISNLRKTVPQPSRFLGPRGPSMIRALFQESSQSEVSHSQAENQ